MHYIAKLMHSAVFKYVHGTNCIQNCPTYWPCKSCEYRGSIPPYLHLCVHTAFSYLSLSNALSSA